MSFEQYQNLAASTAAGNINNSSNPVTFSVQSGDGALFPATTNGPFRITVSAADGTGAEVMLCTSRSGDALTCSRGSSATNETPTPTLVAHSSGDVVSHNVTSGGMKSILSDIIYGDPMTAPTTSTFGTAVDGTNITNVTFANDTTAEAGVYLYAEATAADTNFSMRLQALPSVPYNVRMRFRINALGNQYPFYGFVWRDSGTGKIAVFGLHTQGNTYLIRTTTFSDPQTGSFNWDKNFAWDWPIGRAGLVDFYIQDDNTNWNMYIVTDGNVNHKVLFYQLAHNTYLTANQIGIAVAVGHNSAAPVGNPKGSIKVVDWTLS